MPTDSPLPLIAIEGIGAAIAALLEEMNLYTVFDLLRASPRQIHQGVKSVASLEQVTRWRAVGMLLQVEGLTPQWAEALVAGGVASLEALAQRPQADLVALFAAARAAHTIPDEPNAEQVYEMRLDATRLYYTGALNGTVRDAAGQPLAGVTARIGGQHAVTDARGRFRLTRVPLGAPQRLVLTGAGYAPLAVDDPPLIAGRDTLAVHVYQLEPASALPAGRLSEYAGDVLPALTHHAVSSQSRPASALRERDLFVVHRFYADGRFAQLTSKFLEYEAGTFYVVSFKVPIVDLPAGVKAKDTLIYRGGQFEGIALNAVRLAYFKRLRRVRPAVASGPPPQTQAELDERLADIAARLREA